MITLIKFLTWLASPVGFLSVSGLAAALLLTLGKAPRMRQLLITVGIGQLLFFAWTPVSTALVQGLEAKSRTLQSQNKGGPYTAILVLGGGLTPGLPDQTPANVHEAFDRVMNAAQRYHQGLAPQIIVSGGTSLRENYPQAQTEAAAMKSALVLMGVPEGAILTEDQSLTTRQNMAFTSAILKERQMSGRLALVTSATHMPRAIANARNEGLNVDAYPTDWTTPLAYRTPTQKWLPNAQALESSEVSLKEWLALITGY